MDGQGLGRYVWLVVVAGLFVLVFKAGSPVMALHAPLPRRRTFYSPLPRLQPLTHAHCVPKPGETSPSHIVPVRVPLAMSPSLCLLLLSSLPMLLSILLSTISLTCLLSLSFCLPSIFSLPYWFPFYMDCHVYLAMCIFLQQAQYFGLGITRLVGSTCLHPFFSVTGQQNNMEGQGQRGDRHDKKEHTCTHTHTHTFSFAFVPFLHCHATHLFLGFVVTGTGRDSLPLFTCACLFLYTLHAHAA